MKTFLCSISVSFLCCLWFLSCGTTHEYAREGKPFKKAILAGGCFWSVEAVYERIPGIVDVVSGYSGGSVPNPTDKEVRTDRTGHAESIFVTYDSTILNYSGILDVFWKVHDPTTLNRQGGDVGTQYRSIIFYDTEEEKLIAEHSLQEVQKKLNDKIVTEIQPFHVFYEAGKYHQDYYLKNPDTQYSVFVIKQKLEKLHLKK